MPKTATGTKFSIIAAVDNRAPTRDTNKRKRQLFNMNDVKGNHAHRDSNGTPIQWGQNGPCTDTRFGTTKQKRVRFSDRPAITKQYTCSDGTIIDLSKLLQRFDVGQYFIDNEHSLLYRINVDDSETLCVPNIVAANGESRIDNRPVIDEDARWR